jgi:hypothetical protein
MNDHFGDAMRKAIETGGETQADQHFDDGGNQAAAHQLPAKLSVSGMTRLVAWHGAVYEPLT